jgi:serine/threonine protein kinase
LVENAETQRFCGDCGTPLPAGSRRDAAAPAADETIPLPTSVLEPATTFARRYQIIEELGAGGMGCVYRVLDKKIGEEIALKLIKPEVASDRMALERFSSELKLARQVVHRNVARMFDLNEEGHVPFITMEYVRGENLKRLIRKVGRLAPGQAIPFVCQICAGLDEAHRLGIVHRDLKPQNIMIDEDGQAKILDFGLARLQTGAAPDQPLSRSGTPAYISPEQIRGLAVDARADLYSLGVILYEMLTGRTPFHADTVQELLDRHLREPPRDPREINPGISPELSGVVLRCLEKDPANRYQNAAEMQTALDCLSDQVRSRPSAWTRALRIAKVAGPLAVAAVAFAGLWPQPWKSSLAVLPIEASGAEDKHQTLIEGILRRYHQAFQHSQPASPPLRP